MEEKFDSAQKAAEVAGEAAAVSALAGAGAAAGPAMRLVAVGNLCTVGQQVGKREFPRALHPTQWEIMGSQAAGMVLGNFMITVAFWAVMSLAVRIISYTSVISTLDTLGLCRFPSAPLFVFQFFLQGTSLGSMVLVFYAPSDGAFVVGLTALGFCLLIPCLVLWKVSKAVPQAAYYRHDTETDGRRFLVFLIGPGEWVSRHEAEHWVLRYASVLRDYRQGWAIYSFVEMSSCLAIAAVQAAHAQSWVGCGHKYLFTMFIFLVLLICEALAWPRSRARNCFMMIIILAIQCVAMLLMAIGYYHEDLEHWGFSIAASLLIAAVAILLLKSALDLLSEGYVLLKKRRVRLQGDTFNEDKKENTMLVDLIHETESDSLSRRESSDSIQPMLVEKSMYSDSGALTLGTTAGRARQGKATSSMSLRDSLSTSVPPSPDQSSAHLSRVQLMPPARHSRRDSFRKSFTESVNSEPMVRSPRSPRIPSSGQKPLGLTPIQ